MTIASFDVGDLIRLGNASGALQDGDATAAFANAAGVATNPTAVTLSVEKPDGTLLVYGWPSAGTNGTLLTDGTGRFYFDVSIDQAGAWHWRLAGTGAVETAEEGELWARRSAFS